uniref:Uncharacterized protein n=1 Tax=viral metagenome TaxID=1070528 RepID=A0A6C0H7K3_9ZZZZ
MLKNYYKDILKIITKKDGGREFYQNTIINEIVPFLSNTSIKFKVLSDKEINNLIHQERIRKFKDLLKQFFHNRQLKENRMRNKLQELYFIEIINNLNIGYV